MCTQSNNTSELLSEFLKARLVLVSQQCLPLTAVLVHTRNPAAQEAMAGACSKQTSPGGAIVPELRLTMAGRTVHCANGPESCG